MNLISWIKAPAKYGMRVISDHIYNNALRQGREKAFAQTGKQIEKAKRQGRYIDGSGKYYRNLANNMRIPDQRKLRRDKFINEL